jgi:radical SAM superfamily enzyme YgiQ (UPF0313 family)
MIDYVEPLYRPPAEAQSLIFQAALGCPNNTCVFCAMYKGRPYREKPLKDLFAEIDSCAQAMPETARVFLADGDAMFMPFERLKKICEKLNRVFPALARISLYANSLSMVRKSAAELRELFRLKLHTAYLGLESGSDRVLEMLVKADRAAHAVRAAKRARQSGIRLSVMVLTGAGGRNLSADHAAESARVLNAMQPPLLSMLTMIPVPGTRLFRHIEKGLFTPLSKKEVLLELRAVLAGLNLSRTVFRCNHTSNPLPLEGRLPRDKARLLREIDAMLENRDFLDGEFWASPFML